MRAIVLALLLVGSGAARADAPLRIATLAPDGTAWAREVKAFVREVDEQAHLKIKVYWGGIAGDEREMIDRVHRNQLDGVIGASMCTELSPSLRVSRLQGLFANRQQSERLMRQLPNVDEEFRQKGFVNVGVGGLGPSIIFSKSPIRTWDQLRKTKLWRWDSDVVGVTHSRLMGLDVVPLPVSRAMEAFEAGTIDGFIGVAASSLAWQWHSRAPNILPLEVDYLSACFPIATRAFDALPVETQKIVRAAAAKVQHRLELVGADADRTVTSGALIGHGVIAQPVSPELKARFEKAAQSTREQAAQEAHVPAEALRWVLDHLDSN